MKTAPNQKIRCYFKANLLKGGIFYERKDKRTTYGSYQNVFLSDVELAALQKEIPRYQEYIEKLSSYMVSSGKQYPNHAATIRSWVLRDNPAPVRRSYECKENESL